MQRSSRLRLASSLLAALLLVAAPLAIADEYDVSEASAHVLQGEIALQGKDYLKAAREYRLAAELSEDVEIAQQATRVGYDFGFNSEALKSAKRWLELEPDSDNALRVVAQLQLRAGEIRASRRSFEKLIKAVDQPAEDLIYSLLPDLSSENADDANELMRALAKTYKNSAKVNYTSAVLAVQADDLDYANEKALLAMELDDDWLQPKLLHARVLLLQGEADKAIDYTARIIGDDPDPDPEARMELALLFLSVGRDDDALSQVNQILLEQSNNTNALRLMAIINFRQSRFDAAWDDFEDLLGSRTHTLEALYYLARIADIRGETERAIRLYSQVRAGQNAVVSQRRASALIAFEKENHELALGRLQEFADANPRYAVDMVLARAQLLASLNRYPEALENYEKAVSYRPDDQNTALGRAELLLRMDRLDDSIDAYRDVVRRWPSSATALNALGYTLADRTDEYREAEKLIRKALKFDPESPAIIDSLGWVLYKLGDMEGALEQLHIAYSRFPDHEVASHLVDTLVALDRPDEALELLVAAEERNPDSELLKDVRQRRFPDAE